MTLGLEWVWEAVAVAAVVAVVVVELALATMQQEERRLVQKRGAAGTLHRGGELGTMCGSLDSSRWLWLLLIALCSS
jgi:hypothetical protein